MGFSRQISVSFDGIELKYTYKWNHWLPRMIHSGGITLSDTTSYIKRGNTGPIRAAPILLSHELWHGYQCYKFGKLKYYMWGLWCIIRHPFDKKSRSIEKEAYDNQDSILNGTNKHVKFITKPF